MTPLDLDALTAKLQAWTAQVEAQTKEIEAMLEELDPDWRLHREQEEQERVERKQAARTKKAPPPPPTPIQESDMPKSNQIDADVMALLKQASAEGNLLRIPPERLERGLYERFNEVLSRLGGKWKGGKTQAHVFDEPVQPMLDELLTTGRMPADNPLDYYATPDWLADRMAAYLSNEKRILEPSAGTGAIALAILRRLPGAEVVAVEVDDRRFEKLRQIAGLSVVHDDFAQFSDAGFDAVVMNPPFTLPGDKLAYTSHIRHAHDLLNRGGLLVAIAPASLQFRADKRTAGLRESILADGGTIEPIEAGAFGEAGTGVSTCLIVWRKAERAQVVTPVQVKGGKQERLF